MGFWHTFRRDATPPAPQHVCDVCEMFEVKGFRHLENWSTFSTCRRGDDLTSPLKQQCEINRFQREVYRNRDVTFYL